MKKLLAIYSCVFALVLMGFGGLIRSAPNPEQAILGEWKESGWYYERVSSVKDKRSQQAAGNLGQEVISHKAEIWSFKPNGQLLLSKANKLGYEVVSWSIKGRGNILELKYNDGRREHYDLTALAADSMTLNFELDTQIKGLAKLTFDRL